MVQKLYIHVGNATHFLKWELEEFSKYFEIVQSPAKEALLLSFGPDVLVEASTLPAKERFAVLFPGFGHNPLYNHELNKLHRSVIKKFKGVFVNPGPLEIAYKGLKNIYLYPFSVDTKLVACKKYRTSVKSLLHVSNDGLQKDWQRSEKIMHLTGKKYEVYPPRNNHFYDKEVKRNEIKNKLRSIIHIKKRNYLPRGYVMHEKVIKKYQKYDGFVHVAKDIKHQVLIDGKYTASLIEAGLTGCILFWHDTFSLGNDLKTVFSLPLDPVEAAEEINKICHSIDIKKHSEATRAEMLAKFNPTTSVKIRVEKILELTKS